MKVVYSIRGEIMSNVIRVVVADDNEIMRNMIVDALSDDSMIQVVGEATDGMNAINIIKNTHPDVVLLDLVMPLVDGIGVMEAISEDEAFKEDKPNYIVVSAAGSEDIVNQALQTGASYFIMKPFDGDALVKRVKRICGETDSTLYQNTVATQMPSEDNLQDTEQVIVGLLRNLGVPVRMVGYKYLRDAILIAVNDTDSLMSVTKNVYPEIAIKHGTSSGNVERNIRYVIESTWTRHCERKFDDVMSDLFKGITKKPTNSEFILICSEWVHYQMK